MTSACCVCDVCWLAACVTLTYCVRGVCVLCVPSLSACVVTSLAACIVRRGARRRRLDHNRHRSQDQRDARRLVAHPPDGRHQEHLGTYDHVIMTSSLSCAWLTASSTTRHCVMRKHQILVCLTCNTYFIGLEKNVTCIIMMYIRAYIYYQYQ